MLTYVPDRMYASHDPIKGALNSIETTDIHMHQTKRTLDRVHLNRENKIHTRFFAGYAEISFFESMRIKCGLYMPNIT